PHARQADGASGLPALRVAPIPVATGAKARPLELSAAYGSAMERLRLAELLAGLSLLADAGMGSEPGEAARAALVAMELAATVDANEPRDVYYTTLLQHI